jgi:hypothetical protein
MVLDIVTILDLKKAGKLASFLYLCNGNMKKIGPMMICRPPMIPGRAVLAGNAS